MTISLTDVMSAVFRSHLEAFHEPSHTDELWYNKTVRLYIYIYIYIYIELCYTSVNFEAYYLIHIIFLEDR